jgi:peroxiredoxin
MLGINMKVRKTRLCMVVCTFLSTVRPICAEIEIGQTVPRFVLPVIHENGNAGSEELFRQNRLTYLIFWKSGCPECVRNLRTSDDFFRRNRGMGIGVTGINTDDNIYPAVKTLLAENKISFINLWDFSGTVQQQFGPSYDVFSVFLIDRDGILLAENPNAKNDISSALDDMLRAAAFAESIPDDSQNQRSGLPNRFHQFSQWKFHGKEKIHLMGVRSRGSSAMGLYGESAAPGDRLLYRFEGEASRTLGKSFTAGGLLRIGNEGGKVLRSGPDYLGSEWGSAFVEMNQKRFHARLGYYTAHMSPLTLMRWDQDDNPSIGGNGGCGCYGTTGIITLESLEDLGPDFRFEGGAADLNLSRIQAGVFYAIPRRAVQNTYKSVQINAAEKAAYSLEISGFDFQWTRFNRRTDAFWSIAAHFVTGWEDRQSADYTGLGYPRPDPWNEFSILTTTASVPIFRAIILRGEWILWNPHRQYSYNESAWKQEADGLTAGLVFDRIPGFSFKADVLRLSRDFYSPFAALSYEPNRQGFRISTKWRMPPVALIQLPKGVFETSFFRKDLKEIDKPFPEVKNENSTTIGAAIDMHFNALVGCGIGWMQKIEQRKGEILPFQKTLKAVSAEVYAGFNANLRLHVRYYAVDFSHVAWSRKEKSKTKVFSLYMTADL